MICAKICRLPQGKPTYAEGLYTLYRLVRITRVEDIRPAKSDRGEDDVAPEEEQVGDAEGGQQVVEHVVHLPVGKNSENNILNKNF